MTKSEYILTKLAGIANIDWKHIGKEFMGPSLVAGPLIGLGVTAAMSGDKDEFKHNAVKGIAAGLVGDALTGVSMGLWNQRKAIMHKMGGLVTQPKAATNNIVQPPKISMNGSNKPPAESSPQVNSGAPSQQKDFAKGIAAATNTPVVSITTNSGTLN